MTSTDEQRWADAKAVLRHDLRGPTGVRVRRRRRRITGLLLAGPLLGGVVAGLIGGLVGEHQRHPAHHVALPVWRTGLGIGLDALGLLLAIASVVLVLRGNPWKASWRSPLFQLSRAQRKSLARQVRGQQPVEPEHLPLARHLAERMVFQRRLLLLFPALLVMWVGQTVMAVDLVHLALVGAYVVLVGVGTTSALRSASRGERFLERHGDGRHATVDAR